MIRRLQALIGLIALPRWRQKQYLFYVFILPILIFLLFMLRHPNDGGEKILYGTLLLAMIGVIISALFNGIRVFGLAPRHHILLTVPIERPYLFLIKLLTVLFDVELSAMAILIIAWIGWHVSFSLYLLLHYEYLIISMAIIMIGFGVIIARMAGSVPSAMVWARIAMIFIFVLGGGGYIMPTAFPEPVAALQNYLPTGLMHLAIGRMVDGLGISPRIAVIMSAWQVVIIALSFWIHKTGVSRDRC